MNNENLDKKSLDMRSRVMADIKQKRIKMRSHFVFVAEKLGLEGALLLAVLVSAVFVSLIFYFIAHTGLEKFLTLGFSGTKVFFVTLPYDYIIFFVLTVALAIYLANQRELFCGKCSHTDTFTVWFFLGALALGIFFGALGVGDFLGGWSKKKIPHEQAIHGQIQAFSGADEVTVIDDNGDIIQIFSAVPPMPDPYSVDKFLRAVGMRDFDNPMIFHAERVRCCDDD